MIFPYNFHYAYPNAIYLLTILIPLIAIIYYKNSHKNKNLSKYINEKSYSKIATSTPQYYINISSTLLVFAIFFIILALMSPQTEIHKSNSIKPQIKQQQHDIIFLLDTSASMSIKDSHNSSRLEYAKEIIDEIAKNIDGQNVSLYSFTSELTTIVPSTPDILYLRLMLENININEGDSAGTDLLNTFDKIYQKQIAKNPKRLKSIVLLTDGGDTYLEQLPPDKRQKYIKTILNRLGSYIENNFNFFSVGVGSIKGDIIPNIKFEGNPINSNLNEHFLDEISSYYNGKYFPANNSTAAEIARNIHAEINKNLANNSLQKNHSENSTDYKQYYQYPLFLGMLFFLMSYLTLTFRKNKNNG